MAPCPNPLNILELPLQGSQLIEASAGTGKTWTIAALYVRLVLGHGVPGCAFHRALDCAEILVLTFTRAATQELTERIRSRLVQAAWAFRQESWPQDHFLSELFQSYPEPCARRHAAWQLERAAMGMDQAAIHTIDAWCQRTLREHAFQSGQLFNQELLSDESELVALAVQDYWRQHIYPLDGSYLDAVLGVWPQLEKLHADMVVYLRYRRDFLLSLAKPQPCLQEMLEPCLQLKLVWQTHAQEIAQWLQTQFDLPKSPLNKQKISARSIAAWTGELLGWANNTAQAEPKLSDVAWQRLQPGGLRDALKPGCEVEIPQVFGYIADLALHLQTWPSQLRLHALQHVAQRMDALKCQGNTLGFDDLQNRLADALDGVHGQALRVSLLAQYPVALIDEFQDTSSVQLRIFDALYRLQDNDLQHAALLIGDPKQAIYGFRGADIHSYLAAKRATQGRHHQLGTNHRASADLVASVNQLFGAAEARTGQGAFQYRSPTDSPLAFTPVAAHGLDEVLRDCSGAVACLTWCFDPEPSGLSYSLQRFANRCALRIATLLADPQAGFYSDTHGRRALQAADIAVLVRDRTEAQAMRLALQKVQVASVFLSNHHCVFATPEAADVLRFLVAVANPRHAPYLRAALATRTFGLDCSALQQLLHSEDSFDQLSQHIAQLQQVWSAQGVLPMLRLALHLFGLPARWQGLWDAQRRLTNWLHLAELLQTASQKYLGQGALIEWFTCQIQHPSSTALEAQILRLESDADLVKIVTIHKSKGLEYSCVFLPFAASCKQAKKKLVIVSHEDQDLRQLHTHITPELLDIADQDRQREDLRLLYVALTRARHTVWAGVAIGQIGNRKDNEFHRSALGYLLTGPHAVQSEAVHCALLAHASSNAATVLELIDAPQASAPAVAPQAVASVRSLPPYSANFDRQWHIGSYSYLVRNISNHPLWGQIGTVREPELTDLPPNLEHGLLADLAPWHSFPKGPIAGNFLHDQLEWLAGEKFQLTPSVQQQLMQRCARHGWQGHGAGLSDWLAQALTCRLPAAQVALCELTHLIAEMEFWLPHQSSAHDIDALCQKHLLCGHARPALTPRNMHGMLMGFADLVFEHQGRYWVLDYKSNHLGPSNAYYQLSHLEAAMAQHRYDVQAALYQLALHRLLQNRLGRNYQPAQHLGGAIYFFLRGVQTPHRGCYHVPVNLALLDAIDHCFSV
jgi:exodeoxyribonuclease V beta subunit